MPRFARCRLSGCIDSVGPILTDAQPVFGPKLKLQLYSLRKGYAHDPEQATFTWNGALYAHAGGGMHDVARLLGASVRGRRLHHSGGAGQAPAHHRIRADAQARRRRLSRSSAIDEDDADEADARRLLRQRRQEHPRCRIETREQLFAFARATAARRKDDGGLAIRLAN